MWKILVLFLISTTTTSANALFSSRAEELNSTDYAGFRLPTTVIPSEYQIAITVPEDSLTGNSTSFTGSVNITFQVTETISSIHLNSLVNISYVSVSDPSGKVAVNNYTQNYTSEITTIFLGNDLHININYTTSIEYYGTLNSKSMSGFYRSQYTINGTKEYLATTQFESTSARKAFPCFDEPQYKATFLLTLTYPSGFEAVSNTQTNMTTIESNFTTRSFYETPIMSTYLLAFIISKFDCTNLTSSILIEVCSRPNYANQRMFALNISVGIIEALDQWTNYNYSSMAIGKISHYAIPDFGSGAMENWGLITYREHALLFDETYTSNYFKQNIAMIIAHELTHMWFGNLVTMKWWDSLFLNEGFARYFQYFILQQIPAFSDYEIEKQLVIMQEVALLADASLDSKSLTAQVWTPAQIDKKFDSISYNKGANILRMIEFVIGTINFQTTLRQYLIDNAYKAATPDILWTAFNATITNGTLTENITFSEFVDNWANKPGFPVVKVTSDGDNIRLSQSRFLYNGSDDTQWYIPVQIMLPGASYVTWLSPNSTVVLENATTNNSWIIVNHNSAGYFRVHYDQPSRARLISTLKSNYTLINEVNRAKIIDDVFNLARAGLVKYSEAFEALDCLKNETSYYPWFFAINNLNYLSMKFGNDSVIGQKVNEMLLDLVDKIAINISSTQWNETDHITGLKLQTVWTAACRAGNERCISEARKLFQELRTNGTNMNPNVRNFVYCNALRYSTDIDTDWNFLWERLQSMDQPQEQAYILGSLGCAKNERHLTYLLDQSINSSSVIRLQDFTTVWTSVYATSSVGLDIAFDYVIGNHQEILAYNPDASSLFGGMAARFTTQKQITKLQQFINAQSSNSTIRAIAESALLTAQQNLEWQSTVRADLNEYFKTDVSPASAFEKSVYLLVLAVSTLYLCV